MAPERLWLIDWLLAGFVRLVGWLVWLASGWLLAGFGWLGPRNPFACPVPVLSNLPSRAVLDNVWGACWKFLGSPKRNKPFRASAPW